MFEGFHMYLNIVNIVYDRLQNKAVKPDFLHSLPTIQKVSDKHIEAESRLVEKLHTPLEIKNQNLS